MAYIPETKSKIELFGSDLDNPGLDTLTRAGVYGVANATDKPGARTHGQLIVSATLGLIMQLWQSEDEILIRRYNAGWSSWVFIDAGTLEGLSASSFIRSDAYDTKTAGHLRFNDNVYLQIGSGGDVEHFWNGSNYYTDINGGANWYIRDGNSSNVTRFTFDVDLGEFTATGDITAFSDKTLKEDIEVIPNALEKVSNIRGVTFTRNDLDTDKVFTGVIAQEVEAVLPEVISTNKDGIKSVAYGNMVGLLIEAIKEQDKKYDALLARVEALEV